MQCCDLPGEVWKDIVGREGAYQVSNLGRVRSVFKGVPRGAGRRHGASLIKPRLSSHGYLQATLTGGAKLGYRRKKTVTIHIAVAEAFFGRPAGKMVVNHKNGAKTDNRVENLEWISYSENLQHAVLNGLANAMNWTAKEIGHIKYYLAQGWSTQDIQLFFGGSAQVISNLKLGKTYSYIPATGPVEGN